jgi:hypothetical protein
MTGSRPLLIDGFCCAGGAAVGYHNAGFEVIGVDIEPQPNYPFEFVHGDALAVIPELCERYNVAAVHNSPPCQNNIAITAGNRGRLGWSDDHVDLIPQARAMLTQLRARYGVPTVIENGVTKKLRRDLTLCGLMFGLPTLRDRYFEVDGLGVEQPSHPAHRGHLTVGWRHGHLRTVDGTPCPKCGVWHQGTVYGVYGDGGGKPTVAEAQRALGIGWTDVRTELNEAIPPAYTEHIGRQLMAHLSVREAA